MASYPGSVKTFTTKLAGDTIAASHVNDLQDEVGAVQDGLLNGLGHTLPPDVTDTYDLGTTSVRWRDLFLSSNLDVSGVATHLIGTGGTGENIVSIRNTTAGVANLATLKLATDGGTVGQLRGHTSTFTTAAPYAANGTTLEAPLAGGLSLAATHASGAISFYAAGTTIRAALSGTQFATSFADGGIWLRNTVSNYVECHIRPASGDKGYVTWTEDSVADRWALGVENGDGTLYLRQGAASSSTIPLKVGSTGIITGASQLKCHAYVTGATTSISSGTTLAAVDLGSEDYDTGTMHDTSTNPSRITIPSGGDGVYLVVATASWAAETAGTRYVQIYKNGATSLKAAEIDAPAAACSQQVMWFGSLVATDYVQLRVAQDSGGAINLLGGSAANTSLMVLKVW